MTMPTPAPDHIAEFMAAVSEFVALTAHRIATQPLARSVPDDEMAAFHRADAALRAAPSAVAGADRSGKQH
jgi:hypothetical protein